MIVLALMITALPTLGGLLGWGLGYRMGRDEIIEMIAEGTHKVEHTTNAFGTLEWRVVEVNKEGMEE